MLEETGLIAHEEGDEFLILTCPGCDADIIFAQRADPTVIQEMAKSHAGRCVAETRGHHPRVAEAALAGR